MRMIKMTAAEMAGRVARFSELKALEIQLDPGVPQAAKDMIYARRLLPVIGLASEEKTPLTEATPIQGAAGMTMTLAVCPPGQGPGLHSHKATYETFTVLQGRFELCWGDRGEDSLILETFDTISLPPRLCRAFRNIGEEEGILQVLITGGVHDMNDIEIPPEVGERLESMSPDFHAKLLQAGIRFTAGIDES